MAVRDISMGTKVGLELVTDKWNALTLSHLTATPTGFMTLRRQVRGISTLRLLTVLAKLTQLDLVVSTDEYEYGLTAEGLKLQTGLANLEAWGNQVITEMQ